MIEKGKVVLAGAGPGDPDLVTVKTLNYIKKADIILTDRLVSPELIENNKSYYSEIIYVGKQCSKNISTPQLEINKLIVKYALQGKLVLRLKGGDVSIFSNILDELEALKAHNIQYEIIPGISAALGAAAYAGIPLTARNISRGVQFLTLVDLPSLNNEKWISWSKTNDTLVFYMSGLKIKELVNNFLTNHVDFNKQIAVIQQATTIAQNTQIFTFDNFFDKKFPEFRHVPTIIIIGKIVKLHHDYKWFEESNDFFSYFDNHKIINTNAI